MLPYELNIIEKRLSKWGYSRYLLERMNPMRLVSCYYNAKKYHNPNVKLYEWYDQKPFQLYK
ncbi:MAG: hypothetical protein A4E54_01266 [Pelotomaculum sp. PtaB.Bin117]|nr:MAG: hypothetical protein A4E54_01266 [Pelotomaculum sp. PtaB.Bin117]OPY59951.1 MAG: hypothetical protein A4E56_02995 [Pelotomaculum sp. PtaU1.Bin065]